MRVSARFQALTRVEVDAAAKLYWSKITDDEREAELWLESGALDPYRRAGYFDFTVFERIYWWKNGKYRQRLGRHVVKNSDETVQRATCAALAGHTDVQAVRALMNKPGGDGILVGVQLPTASALYYWLRPTRGVIVDVNVYDFLGWTDVKITLSTYPDASQVIRDKAHALDVNLRKLDRALWVLGGAAGC